MPNMETGNTTARAEEIKLQANEAFKGVHVGVLLCFMLLHYNASWMAQFC